MVWLIVVLNGCGGLLVAATMQYADNIVKCFAAAVAILCGTVLSVPIFQFSLSGMFVFGAVTTGAATVLYTSAPRISCLEAALPGHTPILPAEPRSPPETELLLRKERTGQRSPGSAERRL